MNRSYISLRQLPLLGMSALLLISLLGWYAWTTAGFLAAAPSPGFSRELHLASLSYGFSMSISDHVQILRPTEDHNLRIFAVDGQNIALLEGDLSGIIEKKSRFAVDLSQSTGILVEEDKLGPQALFAISRGLSLYRRFLTESGFEFSQAIPIASQADTMARGVRHLFFSSRGQLFALPLDAIAQSIEDISSPPPMQIELGSDRELLDFLIQRDGERTHLLTLEKEAHTSSKGVETRYRVLDENLSLLRDEVILPMTSDEHYHQIRDMRVDGELLTLLYFLKDRRYQVHYITAMQKGMGQPDATVERLALPYYNSRYTISSSSPGSVSFLFQKDDVRGVNIVELSTDFQGTVSETPLTRTRDLSRTAGLLHTDTARYLVFSDLGHQQRELYLASSDPIMISTTTDIAGVNPWYLAGLSIFMALVAAVLGIIYLAPALPLPLLIAGLRSLPGIGRKMPWGLELALQLVTITGIKLLSARFVITETAHYMLRANWIGEPPVIYFLLLGESMVTAFTGYHYLRKHALSERSSLGLMLRMSLVDYLLFVLSFLMYVASSVVIGGI